MSLAGTTVNMTRQLTLNEVIGPAKVAIDPVTGLQTAYPGGPLEVVLNNTKWNGMRYNPAAKAMEPVEEGVFPPNHPPVLTPAEYLYSELPKEGDTEVWEIINLTADAHPIHLHLAQFQILNRQNFNSGNYMKKYAAAYGGVVKEAYGPPYPYSNTTNPDFAGHSERRRGESERDALPAGPGARAQTLGGRLEGHRRHAPRPGDPDHRPLGPDRCGRRRLGQ